MAGILPIAADWKLRAPVSAQLCEEGFRVRAFPSLETATDWLLSGGEQPELLILDPHGTMIETQAFSLLRDLAGENPLMLCGGVYFRDQPDQKNWMPSTVLLRSSRVADVTEQARKILACPQDGSRGR